MDRYQDSFSLLCMSVHGGNMARLGLSETHSAVPRERQFLSTSVDISASLAVLKTEFDIDSPAQVLHQMIVTKESGKMVISDPRDGSVAWQIYVGRGEIHHWVAQLVRNP
jgi:hypothetical protein